MNALLRITRRCLVSGHDMQHSEAGLSIKDATWHLKSRKASSDSYWTDQRANAQTDTCSQRHVTWPPFGARSEEAPGFTHQTYPDNWINLLLGTGPGWAPIYMPLSVFPSLLLQSSLVGWSQQSPVDQQRFSSYQKVNKPEESMSRFISPSQTDKNNS